MAFASTAGTQIAYIKESVFGTTPVSGNPRNLRVTGFNFNEDRQKESSEELRSDRGISGATTTYVAAKGSIPIHMSYGEYDPLLEALAQSTYTVYGTNGVQGTLGTITATATTLTASIATTGNDSWANLRKGQWFTLIQPGTANDGKAFLTSSTVACTTTVITLDAGTPATVTAGIAASGIRTSSLTHGTTLTSWSFEQQQTDIAQYLAYRGMNVNTFNLELASKAKLNGSFDLMGSAMTAPQGTTTLPGTAIASRSFDIMNASVNVTNMWMAGAPVTDTRLKKLSLKIDNGLREQDAIASSGLVGVGNGSVSVTGSFEAYFSNATLINRYRQDVYFPLAFTVQDTSGNGYAVVLPRAMLLTCETSASKMNEDCMVSATFQAYNDDANVTPALRKTFFFDRFGTALT